MDLETVNRDVKAFVQFKADAMECQKMLQNNEWRELPQDPFQPWLFLALDV